MGLAPGFFRTGHAQMGSRAVASGSREFSTRIYGFTEWENNLI